MCRLALFGLLFVGAGCGWLRSDCAGTTDSGISANLVVTSKGSAPRPLRGTTGSAFVSSTGTCGDFDISLQAQDPSNGGVLVTLTLQRLDCGPTIGVVKLDEVDVTSCVCRGSGCTQWSMTPANCQSHLDGTLTITTLASSGSTTMFAGDLVIEPGGNVSGTMHAEDYESGPDDPSCGRSLH